MKLFIFCIGLLIGLSNLMAQPLHGTYREGADYMEFDGNKVSFNIVSEGGLVFDLRGAGTYTQTGHFLVINTHEYDGPRSSAREICDGSSDLVVEGDSKLSLPATTVLFGDEKGNFMYGTMLDTTGHLLAPVAEGTKALRFSALGMEDFILEYRSGCTYKISMLGGELIEDATIVLMMGARDGCKLELSGMTMDYKKEQPTEKELIRWARKHNKGYFKSRIRVFQRDGC